MVQEADFCGWLRSAALLLAPGLILLSAVSALGQQASLSNAHIEARFDANGLDSIRDLTAGVETGFTRDGWSLAIDQATIESKGEPAPHMRSTGSEVVYTFHRSEFEVQVHYRLDKDRDFLTKQLVIVAPHHGPFRIQNVVSVHLSLKQSVASSEEPGTYTPQFGYTPQESKQKLPTRDFGAFLRMTGGRDGLLVTIGNPYLQVARSGREVSISYAPDLEWDPTWGHFESDVACIHPYHLSGRALPQQMTLEWKVKPASAPVAGLDEAEIAAFRDCVRAFMIDPAPDPVSVEVGWTLNDYQIDVGKPRGIAEYHRIIDVTSQLGIKNLLYAPSNSTLSDSKNDTDSWHWEHVLWLNLGPKIRAGQWDPATGAIPNDVQQMIAYARSKGVGLLAYVYPSVPFQQDKSWLVPAPEPGLQYATLASRKLQDMLIRDLITFKRRTGITGYSFDYTWLNVPGSSSYAQWYGWQRVVRELRRAEPSIVIDGRQSYQEYGPWSWLAGTYPHPTGNDEQPESFTPYPDLHFDRVSADRLRFVNYWYRNYQFAPAELIPGYATHQTERSKNVETTNASGKPEVKAVLMNGPYRLRDWDYLGYRYSLLSSIATGGWNNVIDMIPARDEEEFKHFSEADKRWIRGWIDWTVSHKELLRHTRTILDQPAMGHVDGTAAMNGDHGYLFLFNPNYKRLGAVLTLDQGIGLTGGGKLLISEIYPQKGRLIGKPGAGTWSAGDKVRLDLEGTTATVLEIKPAGQQSVPLVFNAGEHPTVTAENGMLTLTGVSGEPGTDSTIGVLFPDAHDVRVVVVNGQRCRFVRTERYLEVPIHFDGQQFSHAQQVTLAAAADGTMHAKIQVPQRVFDQLRARRKAWPIPWTQEDYKTTWLAPERLLLFLQFTNPQGATDTDATLNAQPLHLERAYTSVRVHQPDFVGLYADLSNLQPDATYELSIKMPPGTRGNLDGVFFDNVEPQSTENIHSSQP